MTATWRRGENAEKAKLLGPGTLYLPKTEAIPKILEPKEAKCQKRMS